MEFQYMDEDYSPTNGDTPGDLNFVTADGNEMNSEEMSIETKLQLAERANEIYREQVKFLQEHMNGYHVLVQDKESIIENLMLRYDLGMLAHDTSRGTEFIPSDKIEDKELRRKAEALAQRTILENFELRELVNEMRDENFNLRNEIYDLQDRLNRQALHISKITKNAQTLDQENPFVNQDQNEDESPMMSYHSHLDAVAEEAQHKHEERTEKHNRRQSSVTHPKDFWQTNGVEKNPNEEEEEEDASPSKEVLAAQEMFGQDEARESEEEQQHIDDDAMRKRTERQDKEHARKSTLVMPDKFFEEDDLSNSHENNKRPNKRRGSKQLNEDLKTREEETKVKQQEHLEKEEHNRQESVALPIGFFETDHANSEEAKKIREERSRKARKESIAVPKSFLTVEDPHDSEDNASREKRRKHQRKQSLRKAVGDKGHLSDEDTQKTKHVDFETRRKLDRSNSQNPKDSTTAEKPEITHHRRESSLPTPDLGFKDPALLLATTQHEVKTLKEQLKKMEEEKRVIEKKLDNNKVEVQQMEDTFKQQLEKRMEEKFQSATSGSGGLTVNNKKEIEHLSFRMHELIKQLNHAENSKVNLIQCTNTEINRLNRVINTLLQSDKCKEIARLLLNDTTKQS